ncbi:MAG TPA: DegT/DnrJ/EryC1/StrS family aminotransferase [Thermoanaerobaculia bacterium]|nr:DegT/DnrJ/EryC1/StrS family aminotransferase [Thermoanaerobaculia bacterium]
METLVRTSRLAVHGGEPTIPPGALAEPWPLVTEDDVAAVTATLRSGKLSWVNNTAVRELEDAWAAYCGTRYAIAVNSGTAAIHAAVAAVGVGPGDEVIVPALTFLASASAVIHHQGIPVFADVDPRTFNLDPSKIEEKISDRTKAILVVHLHGLPADLGPIMEIAARHGLKVIEDVAQAQGARYQGRVAGGIGDIGATSIMAGKNLATAGEGGIISTNDRGLRDAADMVKMFGERITDAEHREYNAETMGWNYRFSSILAAFTNSQLKRLDHYIAEVQKGAQRLSAAFRELPGLVPPHVPSDRTHVYHHYRFRVDPAAAGLELHPGRFRKALQRVMAAEGVPLIEYQNRPVPGQQLFQQRQGYGRGCPWSCGHTSREVDYAIEAYPQTLDVIRCSLLVGNRLCMASFMDPSKVTLYVDAFQKVFEHLDEVVELARSLDYREPWEEAARLA